jgi:hypothetical protein
LRSYRAKVLRGTAQIPRFRQVPAAVPLPGVPPSWVGSNDFDLDYHLRFSRLSGRNDLRGVLDEAARIATQAFDPVGAENSSGAVTCCSRWRERSGRDAASIRAWPVSTVLSAS